MSWGSMTKKQGLPPVSRKIKTKMSLEDINISTKTFSVAKE
jgi:hypothetical protein